MSFWLKSIGASTAPLGDDWLTTPWRHLPNRVDLLDAIRFPRNKRPGTMNAGDKLVLLAVGWDRIFGIAVISSDEPYESIEDGMERWPWVLDVTIPVIAPRLSLAPELADIDVATTSVRQQSHIRLTDRQYALAVVALTREVQG